MELDEAQVRALGLRPGGPKELSAAEIKMMGLDPEGPDTLLNKARVLGTAGVEGVANTLNIPSSVVGLAGKLSEAEQGTIDWIRRQFGASPRPPEFVKALTERQRASGNTVSDALNVKPLIEATGVPTDYEAEAKRLGVDTSGWLGDAAAGVRTATGMLTAGAGRAASLLSGLGAGTGHAVGGNVGEMAGAFLAPMLAPRVASSIAARRGVPTTPQLEAKADRAWDAFRATPASLDTRQFAPFARTVESKIAAETGPLASPPAALTDIGKTVAAAEKSGVDIATADLWQLRRTINEKLQSRALEVSDKRVLKDLRKELDSFLMAPKSGPGVSGDWDRASSALKEAISSTRQLKQAQEIEQMIKNAELSSRPWFGGSSYLGNFNLHLRREFNKVIKSGEIKKYPTEVQDAIKRVAGGGPVRTLMEIVGKFAPSSVIPGIGLGAAHISGDEDAMWLASLAMGARLGANKMGANLARNAVRAVQRGGPAPQVNHLRHLAPAAYGAYLSQQ